MDDEDLKFILRALVKNALGQQDHALLVKSQELLSDDEDNDDGRKKD